jgi:hypothetical protein
VRLQCVAFCVIKLGMRQLPGTGAAATAGAGRAEAGKSLLVAVTAVCTRQRHA